MFRTCQLSRSRMVGVLPAWDSRGLADLNAAIAPAQQWELFTAQAVNSRRQITGDGGHAGSSRAYLLTPSNLALADRG